MTRPLTQQARDRLRQQLRREQELTANVLRAEARLSTEVAKRMSVIAAHDQLVVERTEEVADAVITYIDQAGVSVERAALILGRPTHTLARIVRERRQQHRRAGQGPHR